ncbi:MAG: porphobilinogen synthase [Planctomycetota bacterium]|nr:porphobilinogen synthase [Planctomycetota bacterium]
MSEFCTRRLRRLRYNATLREMLAEVRLRRDELIAPLFVAGGAGVQREIPSMPGQFQFSADSAVDTVRRWSDKGLRAVLLFGLPDRKDAAGSTAWDDNEAVQQLTRQIKASLPEMLVITDVCLCEYTDHGHCGPLTRRRDGQTDVDNDAAIESLGKVAVSHASAGADMVAPSAMMDGQVAAIRAALDAAGFVETVIMSYAAKFASSLYGPFRDAADCAPASGDRRTYQMDYRAASQAVAEAQADLDEGTDIIMVKPAATYLDVISELRRRFDAPLAAYHVSGEYAALQAAARAGWLDEQAAILEVTTAIKRAGADLIITYFAEKLADWLR